MAADLRRPSLINESIRFEGGRVHALDGPGPGVTLNEDAVAKYTVELWAEPLNAANEEGRCVVQFDLAPTPRL